MILFHKTVNRIFTSKLVYKILSNYKNYKYRLIQENLIRQFEVTGEDMPILSNTSKYPDFLNSLIYKDEKWNIIETRFHDRFLKFFNIPVSSIDNSCKSYKIKIDTNDLYFKSKGLKDDWIYLYLNEPDLRNYQLTFNATFKQKFREIQFGFRYKDFYNRYRFRIENDQLNFDVVYKGQFYNSLFTNPLPITNDIPYDFSITLHNENYIIQCNNKTIMNIKDTANLFKSGAVALIFWDDNGNSNIEGSLKNVCFTVLN